MADLNPPWALLAELTHACPLHCPYCSNPLELVRRGAELRAEEWGRVFREAAALGVVQAHLSGGEPLLRPDLEEIAAAARDAGVYTQLVTSGLGLTSARLDALAANGVESVQLSVQDAARAGSDLIAGTRSFDAKVEAAAVIRASGLPFGLNVVLHRRNLDHVAELIDLAVAWGAERIELANTQFYGWALRNRAALLPDRAQLTRAQEIVRRRAEELRGRLEIFWVLPDYFEGTPKPCMGGWGSRSLTVAPDGKALPCPAAYALPEPKPPNVRDHSLDWIWRHSEIFNAYRGTAWMPSPCRTCPQRETDFGGCRCQALALTGDASRTDPACSLSPDHHLITDALTSAPSTDYTYRSPGRLARVGGERDDAP
ncbi:pyrroloquinoline quinone biosynthesis protein E [Actinocorallia herbida]|uniref:PqqA peptide cyclase n=1 Tax=Actinocorallia herbida TaxID=58109 RepID=A0A3N1D0W3_9ACTN|nr:pyrroloquinoline quinone biosynthesis protein PqqE [Actinocorallia herbida]ROO87169.1 pyrroloquinoline quinone biosynthesis protein E [Actinocorallia herbida]